ncbi:related to feruloyl esterase B precursor [Fusarium fujikuroi IMI 58289]|uniref:Carboxylic ester hydrolase n=1 Tax=Gibberella fujikuroi (strain CBS 195.34 / IMI 58289 / NRRL A-6831) TaxID=1279085 RepID=S0EMG4_GIBF5|nr:related to feruloyl esterase B precursor [Fusarium fujikuroi IMI 58289]CCT75812.1 related to feruloyl esterase B precursor [Fusarium fujikuroi IMI 58289]SCO14484.1 related to feruloyl esterase B precursor [Fusarium fujikuroi]
MVSSMIKKVLHLATVAISPVIAKPHSKCTAGTLLIPNGTISSVQHHVAGDVIPLPNTVASCGGPNFKANITADLCRIVISVSTSDSSSVRIEAWLPDDWNKRLLATGTGGIGGCIDFPTVQNGAQLGFASFGTNTGHDGEQGFDFFLNQPEVINDFGHRGIHVEAVVAKQIVQQYYGKKASKSYYQGCSTGGRQGLQNAQLYPDDFDGILAGAPGIDWLHIVASKGILARRIGWPDLTSDAYVRPEQWKAIVAKQIELLDPLDGVEDGIIDNPAAHAIDPVIMACGTGLFNSSICLKPQQVASVRAAYEPLADSEGNIVYPGFALGADTSVFSANQVNGTADLNYKVLQDFWRGAVYNDSTWTPHNFTVKDMDFAIKLNPGGVNAAEGELQKFYAKGGKIISYHGQADQTITPKLPAEYYAKVQANINATLENMHSFYRLFFVPGMYHCSGGPGAFDIGQVYPLKKDRLTAEENVLLALTKWVEEDQEPETIIGARFGSSGTPDKAKVQRKYCPYPYESRWDGSGNTTKADSWYCKLPGA